MSYGPMVLPSQCFSSCSPQHVPCASAVFAGTPSVAPEKFLDPTRMMSIRPRTSTRLNCPKKANTLCRANRLHEPTSAPNATTSTRGSWPRYEWSVARMQTPRVPASLGILLAPALNVGASGKTQGTEWLPKRPNDGSTSSGRPLAPYRMFF